MGTIFNRLKLLARSNVTPARVEAVSRVAALGAWFPAVPAALADMPHSVRESLVGRRGDFSAEALYDLIPNGVKLKSEAVSEFLSKRDLSHIESVANAPSRENDIANVLFERMEWNRARGSENMTGLDLARVRLDNFAEGVIHGAQATATAAAQGAIAAALLELPVTAVENFMLVRANAQTTGEAILRVRRDIGRRAVSGAAGTLVFTGIAILGLPVGPIVMPLTVVGGTLYVWSAADRIWKARGQLHDYPLKARSYGYR